MPKHLQQHSSFCTCAECVHRALHPSVPQQDERKPQPQPKLDPVLEEWAEGEEHWVAKERERYEREQAKAEAVIGDEGDGLATEAELAEAEAEHEAGDEVDAADRT